METKGSTNLEFGELNKCLDINNFYCVCKDGFNTITQKSFPLIILVNLDNSDNNVNGCWVSSNGMGRFWPHYGKMYTWQKSS